MKAAVWYRPGKENFRLEELPIPTIENPTDIIIKVRSVFFGTTLVRAITKGHPSLVGPKVVGRLLAGEIFDVGSEVSPSLRKGTRVTIDPDAPCGLCFYCRNLEPIHCTVMASLQPGGMAEYTRVSGRLVAGVYPFPDNISYDEAAFTEILTAVAYGLLQANVTYGDTVLVLGCGGVGLAHIPMAFLRGATRVFLSGTHHQPLQIARQLGAIPVDIRSEDLLCMVLDATDGRGADVVIEAVGRPAAYESALQLVRPGGYVIGFGGCPPETQIQIAPNDIHYKSIKFVGSYHYTPGLFKRALDLICYKAVDLRPILTHSLPLLRVDEAIDIYIRPDCCTLVLHP